MIDTSSSLYFVEYVQQFMSSMYPVTLNNHPLVKTLPVGCNPSVKPILSPPLLPSPCLLSSFAVINTLVTELVSVLVN